MTPILWWNWSHWLTAFWPVPASSTSRVSWGYPGRFWPAHASPCSALPLNGFCYAGARRYRQLTHPLGGRGRHLAHQNHRGAISPVCWAITGTWLRSPHTCNCSTAAARKVSPPPASRFCLPLKPVGHLADGGGFTGTIHSNYQNDKGFLSAGMARGCSTGSNKLRRFSCRAAKRASLSSSCLRATRAVRSSMIRLVASMPTSATSNWVSRSSNSSSSMAFYPEINCPGLRQTG